MSKTYTDADIRRILRADLEAAGNGVIERRMEEAYQEIRNRCGSPADINSCRSGRPESAAGRKESGRPDHMAGRKESGSPAAGRMDRTRTKGKSSWKKAAWGFGTAAAAVLVLAVFLCAADPARASELPVVGGLLDRMQGIFRFSGAPEEEIVYLEEDGQDGAAADPKAADGPEMSADSGYGADRDGTAADGDAYRAADQGITVAVTEYYASNQSVIMGVRIEDKNGFPQLVTPQDRPGNQMLQLKTQETYSFREQGDQTVQEVRELEGFLEDAHTFAGVMRIDYESIQKDLRAYDAAIEKYDAGNEPYPEDGSLEELIKEYAVPEHFQMQIGITGIGGYSYVNQEAEGGAQEDGSGYPQKFRIAGSWDIPAVFEIDAGGIGTAKIPIGGRNADGYGIDYIEVSPVEVTVHAYDTKDPCCAVVLDKDHRPLVAGDGGQFAAYARDISVITVYLCDLEKWSEIKSAAWQNGADGAMDEELYQRLLDENALCKETVDVLPYLKKE